MSSIERGLNLMERFLLLRLLGRGGLGETWLAEDLDHGEQVAVKLWPMTLGTRALDLIEERQQSTLRLRHPAIANPREFHRTPEHLIVSMDYFAGGNLQGLSMVSAQHLSEILAQTTDALATAHANGGAHGNLHIGNVLFSSANMPRVSDFGTCRSTLSLDVPAEPVDDLRALGELARQLIPGNEHGQDADAPVIQALHDISGRLREAPTGSDATHTAAFHADFVALADRRTVLTQESAIQPATVTPAKRPVPTTGEPTPKDSDARNSRVLVMGAFGVLLLIAIGVFTLLPRMVERGARPAILQSTEPPDKGVPPEITAPAENPAAGWNPLEARSEFDTRLISLEERGAHKWGAPILASALQEREAAEQSLQKNEPMQAQTQYDESLHQLDALETAAQEAATQSLVKGSLALEVHDIAAAQQAFEDARTIAPNHPNVESALARILVAEQVSALLENAAREELAGELEKSRLTVAQALALDPMRESVSLALVRLGAALDLRRFNEEMSGGLRALAAGRTQSAREAFVRAQAIRPDAPGPADGLNQSAEVARSAALSGFARRAREAEAQEDYARALAEYKAALRLQPRLIFARDGERRNANLASINSELERLLVNPKRLESREVQQEATALLTRMGQLASPGPRMAERGESLAKWLNIAETPVDVSFRSDGQTQVSVYKVGKLGSFLQRELPLLPGTYTVVGSRDGYRDVRRSITIKPGQVPEPFLIQCGEPL